MKLYLVNRNPIITKLVKLSAQKANLEIEVEENLDQNKSADIVFLDDECLDTANMGAYLTNFPEIHLGLFVAKNGARTPGFSEYVQKPFLPTDLVALFAKYTGASIETPAMPNTSVPDAAPKSDDGLGEMSLESELGAIDGMLDGVSATNAESTAPKGLDTDAVNEVKDIFSEFNEEASGGKTITEVDDSFDFGGDLETLGSSNEGGGLEHDIISQVSKQKSNDVLDFSGEELENTDGAASDTPLAASNATSADLVASDDLAAGAAGASSGDSIENGGDLGGEVDLDSMLSGDSAASSDGEDDLAGGEIDLDSILGDDLNGSQTASSAEIESGAASSLGEVSEIESSAASFAENSIDELSSAENSSAKDSSGAADLATSSDELDLDSMLSGDSSAAIDSVIASSSAASADSSAKGQEGDLGGGFESEFNIEDLGLENNSSNEAQSADPGADLMADLADLAADTADSMGLSADELGIEPISDSIESAKNAESSAENADLPSDLDLGDFGGDSIESAAESAEAEKVAEPEIAEPGAETAVPEITEPTAEAVPNDDLGDLGGDLDLPSDLDLGDLGADLGGDSIESAEAEKSEPEIAESSAKAAPNDDLGDLDLPSDLDLGDLGADSIKSTEAAEKAEPSADNADLPSDLDFGDLGADLGDLGGDSIESAEAKKAEPSTEVTEAAETKTTAEAAPNDDLGDLDLPSDLDLGDLGADLGEDSIESAEAEKSEPSAEAEKIAEPEIAESSAKAAPNDDLGDLDLPSDLDLDLGDFGADLGEDSIESAEAEKIAEPEIAESSAKATPSDDLGDLDLPSDLDLGDLGADLGGDSIESVETEKAAPKAEAKNLDLGEIDLLSSNAFDDFDFGGDSTSAEKAEKISNKPKAAPNDDLGDLDLPSDLDLGDFGADLGGDSIESAEAEKATEPEIAEPSAKSTEAASKAKDSAKSSENSVDFGELASINENDLAEIFGENIEKSENSKDLVDTDSIDLIDSDLMPNLEQKVEHNTGKAIAQLEDIIAKLKENSEALNGANININIQFPK